jgi:hypothetical protein
MYNGPEGATPKCLSCYPIYPFKEEVMKKQETLELALTLAFQAMESAARVIREKNGLEHVAKALLGDVSDIKEMLNPAPEMIDVEEIVGWVNVYQTKEGEIYVEVPLRTKEVADAKADSAGSPRISCQPIKVTVKREKKQPVERSVRLTIYPNKGWSIEGLDSVFISETYPTVGVFMWPEETK